MEEHEEPPSINFIPCMKWIRKGVAKQNPVKIELSKEELTDLVKATSRKLKLRVDNPEADEDCSNGNELQKSGEDEFDMDNYDNDDETQLNVGDIAVYENDDPYNVVEDDPDSDAEDDLIKPDDNLLVVGHVEGYASSLEVFVHNHFEGSLYVHHDILLPSVPLCIEWLNYDPENVDRAANMCAIGSMAPVIEVWDIDLVNCIEPAYKLGRKASRKKGTPGIGHSDAVLDLTWNTNLTHVLASGSADKTVLLWDLETKEPHTVLSAFNERVQSVHWHPVEAETLLVGCCDRTCKIFDCRTPEVFKSWSVEGEVERVLWNHFNPFQFFCSDGNGLIYCFDCRLDDPLWKVPAHSKEVTGLTLSCRCPGFLATASQDGTLKLWDVIGTEPELISEKSLKIGDIQCLETAPDDPFLMASGGDKRSKNLIVLDAMENSAVQSRFRTRELIAERQIEGVGTSTSEPSRVHPVVKKGRKVKDNSLKVVKKRKEFKNQNKS